MQVVEIWNRGIRIMKRFESLRDVFSKTEVMFFFFFITDVEFPLLLTASRNIISNANNSHYIIESSWDMKQNQRIRILEGKQPWKSFHKLHLPSHAEQDCPENLTHLPPRVTPPLVMPAHLCRTNRERWTIELSQKSHRRALGQRCSPTTPSHTEATQRSPPYVCPNQTNVAAVNRMETSTDVWVCYEAPGTHILALTWGK